MRSVCASLASLLWLATAAGCFVEANLGDDDDGPNDSGDSGTCMPGALGCECYGNASCDPGLECAPSTGTCIPAGCDPGEVNCLCDNQSCDEPLLCVAGICAAPGDSSDGSETSNASVDTSGTAGETTMGSTMTDPSTTTDSGEASSSEGMSESSSEDTGPPMQCDDADECGPCASCAVEPGQDCSGLMDTCEAIGDVCLNVVACMLECASGVFCDACCSGVEPEVRMAARAVNMCRLDVCLSSCPDPTLSASCEV